ncbi:hypothetical protein [Metabacillus arenae]|uniref:Uncharacterized protein n=1 Tax=Metabacillus arenae TaxID=2771434 RepID=A0A926NGB2_9BACI|nr:hypothetical protein [Metabacillus arenae]MBD1379978.1 hypothetical protein [Metabacillus arenae]
MIFFQPEFRTEQGEIINVVDTNGKAVGYLAYLYKDEKDLYIMGQLDNPGEKQNFIDMTSNYIDGLKKSILGNGENEPNLFIHLGGEAMDIDKTKDEESG